MSRARVQSPCAAAVALSMAVLAPTLVVAPGYSDPALVRVLLGAVAVAAVAVTTLLCLRVASLVALFAGLPVPAGAVLVVAATWPGQISGPVPGALDALLHSGAHIVTLTTPLPTNVDTLTLPLVATWLAGASAASALRANRPLLALLSPGLLLTLAVVLAGPQAAPGYLAVALLAAAGAVLLGLASAETAVRPSGGSLLPALAMGAVLGGLAAFAAPPVLADWSRRPPDPRSAVMPPTEDDEALNPLSFLPGWAAEPGQPLLTARADRPVELRWVTLAEFTGQAWLPETGYRPAGVAIPPPVPRPPRASPHRAVLTVRDLPGPWLPSVGFARRVEGVPVAYDPASGTLVARDRRGGGRRYTVTGDVPAWRTRDAARALVPTDPALQRYRELPPGAPARVREVAALVAGTDSAFRQAARLAAYLRDQYVLDAKGRGGHGYAGLASFLVLPGEGERGAGTADQFASAFAVLARAAGLPSRVCVGFGAGLPDGAGGQLIRTGDAVAWGEVYFDRVGWVPFDVIPGEHTAAGAPPEETVPSAEPSSTPSPQQAPGRARAQPSKAADGRSGSESLDDLVPLLVAVAAALPFTPLIAVPLLRVRRTRRRLGRGTPEDRILGAWAELLDGLRLAGRPVPEAYTPLDLTARHPDAGLEGLAEAVNAVGFGPPSGPAGEGPDGAQAVVEAARAFVRSLRRARPFARRVLWWLDPRPFFW